MSEVCVSEYSDIQRVPPTYIVANVFQVVLKGVGRRPEGTVGGLVGGGVLGGFELLQESGYSVAPGLTIVR